MICEDQAPKMISLIQKIKDYDSVLRHYLMKISFYEEKKM
jgi:hypothetical protein